MKRTTKSFVAIVATLAITMSVVITEYAQNSNIKALRDNNIEALSGSGEGAFVDILGCFIADDGMPTDWFGPCFTSKPSCWFEYPNGMPLTENGKTYYPCGEWRSVYANCSDQGYCWEMGVTSN